MTLEVQAVGAAAMVCRDVNFHLNIGIPMWGTRGDKLPKTAEKLTRSAYFDAINAKDAIVHAAHLYGPTLAGGMELAPGDVTYKQLRDGMDRELSDRIDQLSAEIAARSNRNELQAIQTDFCDLSADSVRVPYDAARFSDIAAIRQIAREHGVLASRLPPILRPPRVLSANVLMVCAETDEVILHLRSPQSITYPSHLHVFGGAFRIVDAATDDDARYGAQTDRSILHTAMREIREETDHEPVVRDSALYVVSREVDTGYLQFNCLGLRISAEQSGKLKDSPEGEIVRVPMKALPAVLEKGCYSWKQGQPALPLVPSGRALMLAWMAAGAKFRRERGSKIERKSIFSNEKLARAAYNRIIDRII